MTSTPLAILDLVPVPAGATAAQAARNSLDLACQAERTGYARYWFAEHHLNPGVAGTSPAIMIALAASATSAIRLGSGAMQMGHRTALATVEEFGLIDTLYPGRLDLGLGRSAGRGRRRAWAAGRDVHSRRPRGPGDPGRSRGRAPASRSGSWAAAAGRARRRPGSAGCALPPTAT